jgi:hypothetical protein
MILPPGFFSREDPTMFNFNFAHIPIPNPARHPLAPWEIVGPDIHPARLRVEETE